MTTRTRLLSAFSAVLLALLLCSSLGSGTAQAMSPAQVTASGVGNTLYWDLDTFWRSAFRNWGWSAYYRQPSLHYYRNWEYRPQCRTSNGWISPWTSYACNNYQIWYSLPYNQDKLNGYGDHAAGAVLADEWGHLVQNMLGWSSRSGAFGRELFADCLAGMYTKWGYQYSGKLTGTDYSEARNMTWNLGAASSTHPSGAQRLEWFDWGYSQYNINSCAQALR